jgi:hypothetical protein
MAGYFLCLTVPGTLLLLGFGVFLLYDSIAYAGPSQLPEVLAGAFLLASGLISLQAQVRFVFRWIEFTRVHQRRDL